VHNCSGGTDPASPRAGRRDQRVQACCLNLADITDGHRPTSYFWSSTAWCELGYVVTEDTRHLFSASEVAAWDEAVRRYAGDLEATGRPTRPGELVKFFV